jgi:hypothetical protein
VVPSDFKKTEERSCAYSVVRERSKELLWSACACLPLEGTEFAAVLDL